MRKHRSIILSFCIRKLKVILAIYMAEMVVCQNGTESLNLRFVIVVFPDHIHLLF